MGKSLRTDDLLQKLKQKPVIAGLRDFTQIDEVLGAGCQVVFALRGDVFQLRDVSERCKKHDALLFVHVDLMQGIAADAAGLRFISELMYISGILTTRSYLVKAAKEAGLLTIMRLFCLDTEALQTGIQACRKCQPHAVEVLPGLVAPKIVSRLPKKDFPPLIAGGLISTLDEARDTLVPDIVGFSSSNKELWHSDAKTLR
ncbi:MAG: glycerol-3-phosphate responsive antiterminator [Limnochordia bacterium]|nr:glycerol-3-phosphate responsive antiterminator [Limnochordia bacterium]